MRLSQETRRKLLRAVDQRGGRFVAIAVGVSVKALTAGVWGREITNEVGAKLEKWARESVDEKP